MSFGGIRIFQAEDVVDDLDGRSFAFLHAGFTYLLVTSKLPGRSKSVQLKAKISEVKKTLYIRDVPHAWCLTDILFQGRLRARCPSDVVVRWTLIIKIQFRTS